MRIKAAADEDIGPMGALYNRQYPEFLAIIHKRQVVEPRCVEDSW